MIACGKIMPEFKRIGEDINPSILIKLLRIAAGERSFRWLSDNVV